jgi:integrase
MPRLSFDIDLVYLGDKAWHHCLGLAELKDVRFHDSRHCAATDLYANGNPERVIMDIAGWKTPMLSTYRHKNSLKSAQIIKFSSEQVKSDVVPAEKLINF